MHCVEAEAIVDVVDLLPSRQSSGTTSSASQSAPLGTPSATPLPLQRVLPSRRVLRPATSGDGLSSALQVFTALQLRVSSALHAEKLIRLSLMCHQGAEDRYFAKRGSVKSYVLG